MWVGLENRRDVLVLVPVALFTGRVGARSGAAAGGPGDGRDWAQAGTCLAVCGAPGRGQDGCQCVRGTQQKAL